MNSTFKLNENSAGMILRKLFLYLKYVMMVQEKAGVCNCL